MPEAMWTRFLPTMVRVRELIAEGAIGEVRMLHVDFGFRAEWNPAGRLLNPELGGGGLLDVGCYVTSFASMVLGKPARVLSAPSRTWAMARERARSVIHPTTDRPAGS